MVACISFFFLLRYFLYADVGVACLVLLLQYFIYAGVVTCLILIFLLFCLVHPVFSFLSGTSCSITGELNAHAFKHQARVSEDKEGLSCQVRCPSLPEADAVL